MKIFKYELKVILLKPYVLAMSIITLLYGWFLLSTEMILGVSDTAPFSGWTFGKYMGDITLLTMLVSLFLIASVYSSRQKRVGILADVTGFSVRKRMMIKSLIIGGYFLVMNLLLLVMGCVFLSVYFGKLYLGTYLLEYFVIGIPALVLVLGVGNLLGRINPALVFVLMGVILVLAFVAPEMCVDANGARWFEVAARSRTDTRSQAPEGARHLARYAVNRISYLAIGVAAWVLAASRMAKKKKHAH